MAGGPIVTSGWFASHTVIHFLTPEARPIPSCRDMAELVTDYLEGDLPWYRQVAAWLHLQACEACTNYFGQMRRTIALLEDTAVSPPPESEVDAVAALAAPPSGPHEQ